MNSSKASGEFLTLLAQCCPRYCHDRVLFEDLLSEPEEIPFWQSLIYENNSLLLSTRIKSFYIYHLICTWYNFHLSKKLVKMPPCQRNVHIIWLKTCGWCHGNLVREVPAFNLFWKYSLKGTWFLRYSRKHRTQIRQFISMIFNTIICKTKL